MSASDFNKLSGRRVQHSPKKRIISVANPTSYAEIQDYLVVCIERTGMLEVPLWFEPFDLKTMLASTVLHRDTIYFQ